jgi:hypothetical protein
MKKMTTFKKYMLIFLGSVSLVLGVIGMFLPVLPTTSFLLLSSYCYVRSSPRLYSWLIHHRIFGRYIYNYLTYRAIPKRTKVFTVVFLWATLLLSMSLVSSMYLRLFLFAVGIGVSIHVLTLKTLNPEDMHAPEFVEQVKDQTSRE